MCNCIGADTASEIPRAQPLPAHKETKEGIAIMLV
jgi:hypothetical protein